MKKVSCLLTILMLLVSCQKHRNKFDVTIKFSESPTNEWMRYKIEFEIKNNSNEKLYIPRLQIVNKLKILNKQGNNITNDFIDEEFNFFGEHAVPPKVNQVKTLDKIYFPDDTLISYRFLTKKYDSFIKEVINLEYKELERLNPKLSIQMLDKEHFEEFIKDFWYFDILIMEPYETAKDYIDINTLHGRTDLLSVQYEYEIPLDSMIKITRINLNTNDKKELQVNLNNFELEGPIMGFKRFDGKIKSNVLLFPN